MCVIKGRGYDNENYWKDIVFIEEEIKKSIQNGEYKIDINKTAEALAKSLL